MGKRPNPLAVTALAKRRDGATADEIAFITGCREEEVAAVCEELVGEGLAFGHVSLYVPRGGLVTRA